MAEVERSWAPRPKRLLIGVVLIAIGIGGSILNSAAGSNPKDAPTIPVHGPVATQVKGLDGLRVRAELLSTTQASGVVQVAMSFHNNGSHPLRIATTDVHLRVDRMSSLPISTGRGRPRIMVVRPGSYVTAVLRFPERVVPGMTLLYTPSWSKGRSLQWLLWS